MEEFAREMPPNVHSLVYAQRATEEMTALFHVKYILNKIFRNYLNP